MVNGAFLSYYNDAFDLMVRLIWFNDAFDLKALFFSPPFQLVPQSFPITFTHSFQIPKYLSKL